MEAESRLDEAVGSVAEEAARLLAALGRPASESVDASTPKTAGFSTPRGDAGDGPDGESEHVHVAMGEAQSCSWCPVCRSVTLVRSLSPETLTQLAEVATAAATLLADLATRHTESAGEARRPAPERTPPTEPISVDDEEDPA